jgi:hypothetical protein
LRRQPQDRHRGNQPPEPASKQKLGNELDGKIDHTRKSKLRARRPAGAYDCHCVVSTATGSGRQLVVGQKEHVDTIHAGGVGQVWIEAGLIAVEAVVGAAVVLQHFEIT